MRRPALLCVLLASTASLAAEEKVFSLRLLSNPTQVRCQLLEPSVAWTQQDSQLTLHLPKPSNLRLDVRAAGYRNQTVEIPQEQVERAWRRGELIFPAPPNVVALKPIVIPVRVSVRPDCQLSAFNGLKWLQLGTSPGPIYVDFSRLRPEAGEGDQYRFRLEKPGYQTFPFTAALAPDAGSLEVPAQRVKLAPASPLAYAREFWPVWPTLGLAAGLLWRRSRTRRVSPASQRVGDYTLGDLIAVGGSARVYRASKGTQPVALKLFSGSDRQGLTQEVQAWMRLDHPAIARLLDWGESPLGFYIASELLEGESLRRVMQAGPVEPRRWTGWIAQLCSGLEYAHERGLPHLDLKPENIHITPQDKARLLDFGLTLQDPAQGFAGTPAYAAPEQIRGFPGPACDQYALGILLYELCEGKRPFEHPDPRVVAQMQLEQPLPAGERCPEGLRGVLVRLTEKDPARRFPTLRDAWGALQGELERLG